MYSSLKQRWKSSIDLYRSTPPSVLRDDEDDDNIDASCLSDTETSRVTFNNRHRKRTLTAAMSPGASVLSRSPASLASPSSADSGKGSTTLKRIRSYLSDDARQKFEFRFGHATIDDDRQQQQQQQRSLNKEIDLNSSLPKSNNFVKKLVAALERRQKESSFGSVECIASLSKDYKAFCKDERDGFASRQLQGFVGDARTTASGQMKRFNSMQALSPNSRQLEDVHEEERDQVEEEMNEDDYYSCNTGNAHFSTNYWGSSGNVSTICHPEKEDNDYADETINVSAPTASGSKTSKYVRKTIRSVLSSIKSWQSIVNAKTSRSLPKGSRDYYAARESLGEEMRAFRQNTMPKLIERATSRANDRARTVAAAGDDDGGDKGDGEREFNKLIGATAQRMYVADDPMERNNNCATIHPVYGAKSYSSSSLGASGELRGKRLSWLLLEKDEETIGDESNVCAPRAKVQTPPTVPTRSQSLSPSSTPAAPSRGAEQPYPHLSKESRDLQKQLFNEIEMIAKAALGFKPNTATLLRPTSIVYDVPRATSPNASSSTQRRNADSDYSNCPRNYDEARIVLRNPPIYENFGDSFVDDDDDERMQCTSFTTF